MKKAFNSALFVALFVALFDSEVDMSSKTIARIGSNVGTPLLDPSNAKRVCSRIKKNIIEGFKLGGYVREAPGGKLTSDAMWGVEVVRNDELGATIRIKALLDASPEFTNNIRGLDEPHRYAWCVEFGHDVHRPRHGAIPTKLPFVRINGKIWRAKYLGYHFVMERGTQPTRGHFAKYNKKSKYAKQFHRVRERMFAAGGERWFARDVLWLHPGKRTRHVKPAHVVTKVVSGLGGNKYITTKDFHISKMTQRLLSKTGMHAIKYNAYKTQDVSIHYKRR